MTGQPDVWKPGLQPVSPVRSCIGYFPTAPDLDKPELEFCHFSKDFIVKCLIEFR